MNGFFAAMIIIVVTVDFMLLGKAVEKVRDQILAEIRKAKQP